jgi:large subunit ribosomal protein L25
MKIIDLPVETRELLGSAESRRLRRNGGIPIVLYGGGRDSIHLATTRLAFGEVLKYHSAVVRLKAGEVVQTALVREVAWNTFGDHVEHLDLLRVEPEDEVAVSVPLHFVGIPAGISHGGEMQVLMKDIPVLARVKDMPTELRLDISELNVGDSVHVRDYEFPDGVRASGEADDLIIQIKEPKIVEETTDEEAAGLEGEASADEAKADE